MTTSYKWVLVTIRIWEQPVSGSQPDSKLALAQQSEGDLAQSGQSEGNSAQSERGLAQSEGNSAQQSKGGKLQEYVIRQPKTIPKIE
jgi:hypothetical protein